MNTEQINNDRLAQVNPTLAEKCRQMIAEALAAGFVLQVVQGLRTFAEQDALFAQGRTTPGKIVTNARSGHSWHNFGLAVDFCFITNGQPDWTDSLYSHLGVWAQQAGLEWGGGWRHFADRPHVQLINGMTLDTARLLKTNGGLNAVWQKIK